MMTAMNDRSTGVSIIVPAFREAPNLRSLTQRVFAATTQAGLTAELIIVDDDSRDGSVEIIHELSRVYPVRIVLRTGERGLSSAVIRGFAEAHHDMLVVMDADLSHPPETIPALVRLIQENQADFAIGSRYVAGGRTTNWSFLRRLNSWAATLLARPLTPVRDSMSGFFALHRRTLQQAAPLNPVGYKIGLELMVKTRCRRCIEVPIEFADRAAGQSKLTFREQLRYLRHVLQLYWFRGASRFRET
jgi:dolichol-phosphate mannosyltransferase